MATRTQNNPLAQVLEQRIRAIVDEAIESALRDNLRTIFQEELADAIGSKTAAAPAPRRGRPPGRKPAARGRPAAGAKRAAADTSGKHCEVVGCKRPHRSMGYCAAHYQSARKHGWPMPAQKGFVAPPAAPRGRPPKKKTAAAGE